MRGMLVNRKLWFGLVLALLASSVLPALTGTSWSQDDGASSQPKDGDPVAIGTYRDLHSEVLNEDRTLLVSLPRGYEEAVISYPVLYLLYGGQVRGYFAEAVHVVDRLQEAGIIPPLIIVGVKNVDRYRDNLPINARGEEGGAAAFLKFFTDELIPFIDASYRTKDFRVLVGPQAGASFSLYSLLERPDLFRVNITTNPFWNRSVREYLLTRAIIFFRRDEPLRNFHFIRAGTRDDNEETMLYLDRLAAAVQEGSRPGFTLVIDRPGDEEADAAIPSPGLRAGLKAFFKDYSLPDGAEITGLTDLKTYFGTLSQDYGYDVDMPEHTLIARADLLQQSMQVDSARVIYEYVINKYPHNLDACFRLAEMHSRTGDYDKAIAYYEKFLDRRPEPMIQRRLDDLRRYVSESAAYVVKRAILDSGIEQGMARYRELRTDPQGGFYFDESEFNSLGYALVAREMFDAAIQVFRINVEMNPESSNAYDSLGEAYMLSGNTEEAIRNYRKSLELDPDNANAAEMLEKLEPDRAPENPESGEPPENPEPGETPGDLE